MYVPTHHDRREAAPASQPVEQVSKARHIHRERDFGVGYGSSSGYAASKRYTSDWAQPRFRFA